jgi:hypothetical protein
LPHDAVPARPQGSANGYFAGPRGRLAEQQGRRIGARDQEYHPHGAQQKVESKANVTHHFVLYSRHGNAPALVALWILLLETPGNRGHLGLRLFEGDAAFEPRDSEIVLR